MTCRWLKIVHSLVFIDHDFSLDPKAFWSIIKKLSNEIPFDIKILEYHLHIINCQDFIFFLDLYQVKNGCFIPLTTS